VSFNTSKSTFLTYFCNPEISGLRRLPIPRFGIGSATEVFLLAHTGALQVRLLLLLL